MSAMLVGAVLWTTGMHGGVAGAGPGRTGQGPPPATERASVSSGGDEAVRPPHVPDRTTVLTGSPSLSADGRFVAFSSQAANLVPGDTNDASDVFVHDRFTRSTTRLSVSPDGSGGDGWSTAPSISSDGRFVAFQSSASNLVPGDTNQEEDVFVRDRVAGTTTLASVAGDGAPGDGRSVEPTVSADGQRVAFLSRATTFDPRDTDSWPDAYVRDLSAETTSLVSLSSGGEDAPTPVRDLSLSSDGDHVVFTTQAWYEPLPDRPSWFQFVFVRDLTDGTTTMASVSSAGTPPSGNSGGGAISADGRFVAFRSGAADVVAGDVNDIEDHFLHDTATGRTVRVSESVDGEGADRRSFYGGGNVFSDDGRFLFFHALASNLVADDDNDRHDVFRYELGRGSVERVSVGARGAEATERSLDPSVSGDGRIVAYTSHAPDLVRGDANDESDVFVSGPVNCIRGPRSC